MIILKTIKTENMTTIENFLREKLNNFISYCEKTIGTENKLYPQIKQLVGNERGLINYAEYLSKAAKLDAKTKKYYFEESTIVDYLENNGFKKVDLVKVDNNEFIPKLKRYLEMFVNVICT